MGYAIGTIAAAAFGAILYSVVTGDSIVSALTNIIHRAFNTNVCVMALPLTVNDESADAEYHYGERSTIFR